MSGIDDTRRVARLAARQHGNVTFAQLRECGLDEDEIEARAGEGWLIHRHRRTYAVGHVPGTRESRWCAAALALGPPAVLSHTTAGALWGIIGGSVETHVIVPTGDGRPHRDGIRVHRQALPPEHRSTRSGIPCTNLLRTLLDLAAILSMKRLSQAFEEAQVIGRLQPEALAAEVLSRRGHRGNAKLRLLLDGAIDPAGVRSILELRFLRMCAAHGIPRPLVNERIGIWTPDFLWPDRMLIVETDGVEFHRTPAKRRRDTEKDAHFRALGFQVERLTWSDVVRAPEATARRIIDGSSVAHPLHMAG